MGRSLTLRVYRLQLVAHFGLAFATATCLKTLILAADEQLAGSLCKRHAVSRLRTEVRIKPPTACRRMVSGSATPHLGFFSPFPHGTGSLSVTREYLALRDGPRRFPPDFTCPAVLGRPDREPTRFRLRDFHPLWSDFPDGSTSVLVYDSPALRPSGSRDTSARKRARV